MSYFETDDTLYVWQHFYYKDLYFSLLKLALEVAEFFQSIQFQLLTSF